MFLGQPVIVVLIDLISPQNFENIFLDKIILFYRISTRSALSSLNIYIVKVAEMADRKYGLFFFKSCTKFFLHIYFKLSHLTWTATKMAG